MLVQETKQDYWGFTVEFKSDHLFVVLKLSIVLGDVPDGYNMACGSPDPVHVCSSELHSYV